MKPYLVDVPVRVNVWIRPECQRKQFEVLKQARPSIMFLVSDGGRNEKEWEAIHKNRKIFEEEVDWECTIYKLYKDTNHGLYTMSRECRELVWSTVDRCIFLEDDVIPSVSFFRYCAELLERYKDDERVNVICGMNHLEVWEDVNTDYFFSRQGSISGVATWRRTGQRYNDFEYGKDPYIMKLLKQRTMKNKAFRKRYEAYAHQEYYGGHVAGGEFFYEFGVYGQHQLQIIPKKNMICNIGCTEDSEHAAKMEFLPKGVRRIFNMPTYEVEFPLKHAKYVIPDAEYEKKRNRILAYNCPLVSFYRQLEKIFYSLTNGNIQYLFKKLKKKIRGRDYIER